MFEKSSSSSASKKKFFSSPSTCMWNQCVIPWIRVGSHVAQGKKIFFHTLVILTSLRFFLWGGVHNQDAGAGLSQIDLEACEYQDSHKKINNVNICLQEDLFAFYYFSSKRHLNVLALNYALALMVTNVYHKLKNKSQE